MAAFVDPTSPNEHHQVRVHAVADVSVAAEMDISGMLRYVAEAEEISIRAVSVVLADHAVVLKLNKAYLGHDYHTDVLAFPYAGPPEPVEGDVYVDVETAEERHEEFGADLDEEIARYVIHGFLHLAGYSDKAAEAKERMNDLEGRYLQATRRFWREK